MNLLLDTHAFIWWAQGSDRLSTAASEAIADPQNVVFVSSAVIWEIVIKVEMGKLDFDDPVDTTVDEQCLLNGFHRLAIEHRHVHALRGLPYHHKDPFDRILMAQAIADDLTLVTTDPLFANYPVTTLW